jgi:hypothetical protein
MAITLRTAKGSALTHSELDANFTTLDSASNRPLNYFAGDSDIDFGSNKILYSNNYATTGDLPSASTYHGMFAHVHAEARGYYAHGGAWIGLANQSELTSGGIALTDLSVSSNSAGTAALSYNNSSGAFSYTPPDLSSYYDSATFHSKLTTNYSLGGGGGLADVVDDATPQLGGDLDVNGKTIAHTFTMGSNGSSDYTFSDAGNIWFPTTENDPVLYLRRGEQYIFVNSSGGSHPFEIRASAGGSAYSTGVTNNGASSGNIIFKVPMSAPATLYYQCTAHASMGNTINIV